MERGKPLLIEFPFVLNMTRRGEPILVAFPFVLTVMGRGKPLLIVFPFILTATGRGKPPLVALKRYNAVFLYVRYVLRSAELDAAVWDGIGMRDGTGVRKVTKREERTYCQGITLGPRESQS